MSPHDPSEFRELARKMRAAQKRWYAFKDRTALEEAKRLERVMDEDLSRDGQGSCSVSATVPNCTRCGKPYSIPSVYRENDGLCTACRPIPTCRSCNGWGSIFTPEKRRPTFGTWSTCARCNGSRHEMPPEATA